ncbi:pilin [Candidatus Saccharibacteria bacterium]|nr:pilin [Candidatus Saccharibacteria bacterium]
MRLKKLLVIATIFIGLLSPSGLVYADDSQLFGACKTNSSTQSSSICQDQGTNSNPANHYIKVATSIVATLTGIAAVIFIILGGLTMITSSGNAEAVANARKRIIYAVIGLVIVALAWAVITFLTNRLIKT